MFSEIQAAMDAAIAAGDAREFGIRFQQAPAIIGEGLPASVHPAEWLNEFNADEIANGSIPAFTEDEELAGTCAFEISRALGGIEGAVEAAKQIAGMASGYILLIAGRPTSDRLPDEGGITLADAEVIGCWKA